VNLAAFRICLAEKNTVRSLSPWWIAYRIGVVAQCCHMV